MKYLPQAAAGYTSLGDGGRAMEHEIRDLVMPDLQRCGGESVDGFDTCFAELSEAVVILVAPE